MYKIFGLLLSQIAKIIQKIMNASFVINGLPKNLAVYRIYSQTTAIRRQNVRPRPVARGLKFRAERQGVICCGDVTSRVLHKM